MTRLSAARLSAAVLATWALVVGRAREREAGTTAVEYGLMVALFAVVLIVAAKTFNIGIRGQYNNTGNGAIQP